MFGLKVIAAHSDGKPEVCKLDLDGVETALIVSHGVAMTLHSLVTETRITVKGSEITVVLDFRGRDKLDLELLETLVNVVALETLLHD